MPSLDDLVVDVSVNEQLTETVENCFMRDPTKVVVRLLPPDFDEEQFRALVGEELLGSSNWTAFVACKDVEPVGYLGFKNTADAESAISKINGKVVPKSNTRVLAAFATNQETPVAKLSSSVRSLEETPIYKEYLAACSGRLPLPPRPNDIAPLVQSLWRPFIEKRPTNKDSKMHVKETRKVQQPSKQVPKKEPNTPQVDPPRSPRQLPTGSKPDRPTRPKKAKDAETPESVNGGVTKGPQPEARQSKDSPAVDLSSKGRPVSKQAARPPSTSPAQSVQQLAKAPLRIMKRDDLSHSKQT